MGCVHAACTGAIPTRRRHAVVWQRYARLQGRRLRQLPDQDRCRLSCTQLSVAAGRQQRSKSGRFRSGNRLVVRGGLQSRSRRANGAHDVSLYYYTYEDLQATVAGTGGGIVVDNVGQVDGWGIEGSVQWIVNDNIDLYVAGAYADTEVNDAEPLCDGLSDCNGKPLAYVPEFSGSAVFEVHHPFADGEMRYTAEVFGQTETHGGLLGLSEAENDAYYDLTLRAGYEATAGWSVVAYVENVTDEEYFDGVAEGSGMLPAHWFGPSRGRTAGLRMSWDF
ncbi:MAG: TonB-dependent receptor [Gammaproteobacteria bacterium]|nr:TonB-dependent receptor [Gammaproteobacteria bacterium]